MLKKSVRMEETMVCVQIHAKHLYLMNMYACLYCMIAPITGVKCHQVTRYENVWLPPLILNCDNIIP